MMANGSIELQLWSEQDLPLVRRYLGDPGMMKHLGGAQSEEQIAAAHRRYLDNAARGTGWVFKVVVEGDVVGSIGYWEKEWQDQIVYEMGWSVFPEFQGRGYARAATEMALDKASREGTRRCMHAFPAVDNAASNAIALKTGFKLIDAFEFEYQGHVLRCNDWALDLGEPRSTRP